MTTTEYMIGLPSNKTFFDIEFTTNNKNLSDLATLINDINTSGGFSHITANETTKIPLIRIPLTASYWLNEDLGDNPNEFNNGYRNAIVNIVAKINSICNNSVVIILDLHWNYPDGSNGGQKPMALKTNTKSFWESISYAFGIKDGVETNPTTYSNIDTGVSEDNVLDPKIKNNIFFELYNEPFLDNDSSFEIYIHGGFYEDPSDGISKDFEGMLTMYQAIRAICDNMLVISGAEQYAWFKNYYYNYVESPSCFTTLNSAIFDRNGENMRHVMLNIHPYTNSNTKMPGFSYDKPDDLLLGDMLLALTQNLERNRTPVGSTETTSINFQTPYFPIIATEFGQYTVPWGYYPAPPIEKSKYEGVYYSGTYSGQYYDQYGTATAAPALIGFVENFQTYNVSYCFWAARPNDYQGYPTDPAAGSNNFFAKEPDSMTIVEGELKLMTSDLLETYQNEDGSQYASGDFKYIFENYMKN